MGFPGYDDSYFISWLFNGYLDGYTFDEMQEIPKEYLTGVIIQESISQLFSTVQILFNDMAGTALDKQGTSQFAMELGLDPDTPAFWDFCSVTLKDSAIALSKEAVPQDRAFNGIDTICVPLLARTRRTSYGNVAASDVAKTIVERIFSGVKMRNPKRQKIWYNIDKSIDKEYYNQCGKTDAMFLNYLANKAISQEGLGGYVTWFDCRKFKLNDDSEYDMRFNFVHPNTLAQQEVYMNLLYSQSPDHAEEASESGGYLPSLLDPDGKETMLVTSLDTKYASLFNIRDYTKRAAWYDLNKLSYHEKEFDLDDFPFYVMNPAKNISEERKKQRYDYLYSYYKNEDSSNKFDRLRNFGTCNEKVVSGTISNDMSRLWFKRQVSVITYGDTWTWLGDKVRLKVPILRGDVMESLSADWIVGKITHMISFPAMQYTTKMTLFADEYKGDIEK